MVERAVYRNFEQKTKIFIFAQILRLLSFFLKKMCKCHYVKYVPTRI